MGCKYSIIKCKKNREKELIEMLILHRNKIIKSKITKDLKILGQINKNPENLDNSNKSFIIEKEPLRYKTDFLNDTNNENNLMKYLNELKKFNIIEYEKILLLYFNVLSCENKTNLTGNHKFISYIDKFELLIDDLYNNKDPNIIRNDINCGELIDRYILFEKGIIFNIHIDGKNLKILFNQNREEFNKILKSFLTEKINSKVTLQNKEVYFQNLTNTKFINNNDDRTEFFYIYNSIKECIKEIKSKEIFTEEDNRVFFIIFFAPIISSKLDLLIKPNNLNLFYKYEVVDGILYVKDKNSDNIIFTLNEGDKIDKTKLNKLLIKASNTNFISKKEEERIIIKSLKLQYFQNYNFYTKSKDVWDFNIKLMKYIFQSPTMKSLFSYVYPEVYQNGKYIFNNIKILEELANSFIFVPYKLSNTYGFTLKDYLVIFINGLPPRENNKIQILNGSSSFQILALHEGAAHWTSAYCSYTLKNNDFYQSVCYEHFPLEQFKEEFERNNLIEANGGDILERILFSRSMDVTDIREMLFILCRNSYNGTYISFKQNFQKISKINLETVYNEVIKDNCLKEYLDHLKIDLEYLKEIKNKTFEMKMKRNGKFLRRSICFKELLKTNHIFINEISCL